MYSNLEHPLGTSWSDNEGNIIEKLAWAQNETAQGNCAVIDYTLDRLVLQQN